MSKITSRRYVVGAENVGVLDTARRKAEAFTIARTWARRDASLDGVYVEDRLARMDAPWLWYYRCRDDALHVADFRLPI